jgi:uncharacterized membrane protein YbhN (UPF0104 family)
VSVDPDDAKREDERTVLAATPRRFRVRVAWWIASLAAIVAAMAIGVERMPDTAGLRLDWRHAIPLAFGTLAMQVALAAAMRVLLGGHVGLRTAVAVMFASSFLNFVSPARFGALFRTLACARLARVSFTESLGGQALLALLSVASAGVLACAALPLAARAVDGRIAIAIATLPLLAAAAMLLSARAARRARASGGGWLARHIARFGALSDSLAGDPRRLVAAATLCLASSVFAAVAVHASYAASGAALDFAAAAVLVPVTVLSTFVAFTPGGLGTREALLVIAGASLGLRPETAIAAALLERVVASLVLLASGGPALLWLNRRRLR